MHFATRLVKGNNIMTCKTRIDWINSVKRILSVVFNENLLTWHVLCWKSHVLTKWRNNKTMCHSWSVFYTWWVIGKCPPDVGKPTEKGTNNLMLFIAVAFLLMFRIISTLIFSHGLRRPASDTEPSVSVSTTSVSANMMKLLPWRCVISSLSFLSTWRERGRQETERGGSFHSHSSAFLCSESPW